MKIKLYYLIVIILFSEACNKDDGVVKATSVIKNCYLLKSTHSSDSLADYSEEVYRLNSENKVIEFTLTNKYVPAYNYSERYYYGSNGKVSKTEGANYHFAYSYNSSNQLISLSYYLDNIIQSRADFQYNSSGQLIKKVDLINNSNVLVYYAYSSYTYADNNSMNAIKESIFNQENVLQYYIEYEYDDKINPFSNIGLDQSMSAPPSVNNVIKWTYTQITGTLSGLPRVQIAVFSYQYNDRGYPIQELNSGDKINFSYDCK